MRRNPAMTAAALLATALAALLAGCGGGTKTVTAASSPSPEPTSSATAPRASAPATAAPTTPTSTTPAPSANGTPSPSPSTTRTAPAPAFTHQSTGAPAAGGELSAAETVLHAKGFTPGAASDYHPDQTLRVLIGTRTGSAEGNGRQAFFFVDGRYIGTDAKQPSASISVLSQGDTEVTLAYSLTSGVQAKVSFQLNNGKLVPLEPIPPASSRR